MVKVVNSTGLLYGKGRRYNRLQYGKGRSLNLQFYKVSLVMFLCKCEHSTGSIRLLEFVIDGDQGLQGLGGRSMMKFFLLK